VLPFHDPSDNNNATWQRDHDPSGKPAQAVICQYFAAGTSNPCTVP
jgi:hypothetical protein